MSNDPTASSLVVRREGPLGHITLNRPHAINALTIDMVDGIGRALDAWADDPRVASVLLDGAGDRGFCAGADIRALRQSALDGSDSAVAFWRHEYHVNATIARYPKPIVALMDGIVMGGGIGLAAHASDRVASRRLRAAMPEVGIGYTPDIGSAYLLGRSPGQLGTHLALTGQAVGAADARLCGLVDRVIDPSRFAQVTHALRAGTDPTDVMTDLGNDLHDPGELPAAREWIDRAYTADSATGIVERLRASPEPGAQEAATLLQTRSPTSLKVTLRALRRARELPSLEDCLNQDFRLSCRFLEAPDFVEGIRAMVVDKDRSPRWRPATLEQVTESDVDRFFADLGADELGLVAPASGRRPARPVTGMRRPLA